jgi:hypothetical protein
MSHLPDTEAQARAEAAAGDRIFAEIAARCAKGGFGLMAASAADGRPAFLIARWGRTIELPDLPSVEAWITRATGADQ